MEDTPCEPNSIFSFVFYIQVTKFKLKKDLKKLKYSLFLKFWSSWINKAALSSHVTQQLLTSDTNNFRFCRFALTVFLIQFKKRDDKPSKFSCVLHFMHVLNWLIQHINRVQCCEVLPKHRTLLFLLFWKLWCSVSFAAGFNTHKTRLLNERSCSTVWRVNAVSPPHPRRLCSRHVHRSQPGGAGSVGGGLVPAEQRPQTRTPAPLDDAGSDLASRRCAHVYFILKHLSKQGIIWGPTHRNSQLVVFN